MGSKRVCIIFPKKQPQDAIGQCQSISSILAGGLPSRAAHGFLSKFQITPHPHQNRIEAIGASDEEVEPDETD